MYRKALRIFVGHPIRNDLRTHLYEDAEQFNFDALFLYLREDL